MTPLGSRCDRSVSFEWYKKILLKKKRELSVTLCSQFVKMTTTKWKLKHWKRDVSTKEKKSPNPQELYSPTEEKKKSLNMAKSVFQHKCFFYDLLFNNERFSPSACARDVPLNCRTRFDSYFCSLFKSQSYKLSDPHLQDAHHVFFFASLASEWSLPKWSFRSIPAVNWKNWFPLQSVFFSFFFSFFWAMLPSWHSVLE